MSAEVRFGPFPRPRRRHVLSILLFVVFGGWHTARCDVWVDVGVGPWSNRTGAAADTFLVNNTYVSVIAGGESPDGSYFNDVWVLRANESGWRPFELVVGKSLWAARSYHTLTFFNGSLFITGGLDSDSNFYNDVWASTDGGLTWTQHTLPPWSPRAAHSACTFNGSLFIMGGYYIDSEDASHCLNDIWMMSASGVWTDMLPPGNQNWWNERAYFALGVYNGAMYVTGGTNYESIYNDIWMLTPTSVWTQITANSGASLACMQRFNHRLVVTDRMWLVGDGHMCWSVNGMSWNVLPPTMTEPAEEGCNRQGFVAAAHASSLAIMGGILKSTYIEQWWTFSPCVLDCGVHGACVLSLDSNLTSSCQCDPGYSGTLCDQSSNTPWDNFKAWFNGPVWHVLLVALGACVLFFLCCPLCIRVLIHRRKKAMALEEVVLGRLSRDWVINSSDLVYNPNKPIGAGGFAQVFRGSYNGVTVAVKVIHAYLLKTEERKLLYMQRFADEAEMMSKLHHPNLQCLLGISLRPQFCLVTEYAPYGSLSDVLLTLPDWSDNTMSTGSPSMRSRVFKSDSSRGSGSDSKIYTPLLTPAMAVKIVYQIACGAMCLHSRNITHRDLNTNNVLVYCLEYDRLNVRVSDFGLSRELEAGVATTMTGFVGSPAYIAPEVLGENAKYDERADVYSYGVLVWSVAQFLYLSTQRERKCTYDEHKYLMRPYGDWAPMQVMRNVVEGVRPRLPPARFPKAQLFLRLMTRCWDHDTASRPTFEQICTELQRFVDDVGDELDELSPTAIFPQDPQSSFSPLPPDRRAPRHSIATATTATSDDKGSDGLNDGLLAHDSLRGAESKLGFESGSSIVRRFESGAPELREAPAPGTIDAGSAYMPPLHSPSTRPQPRHPRHHDSTGSDENLLSES